MQQKNDKRTILHNILNGSSTLDSPVIERSVLTGLAAGHRPDLKDSAQVWLFGLPALLGVAGFALLFREQLDSPTAMAIVILVFVGLFGAIWHIARSRDDALRQQARILQEPVTELRDLQGLIKNYLANLDKRTSRYFHVVTNSKVTSYFVLTQISQTLQERVNELSDLLSRPTRENILISHQLLQGTLVFSDSFQGAAGNMHVVPLARLKVAVHQIFEFLDSELKLLEDELAGSAAEAGAEDDSIEEQGEPH